MKLKNKDLKDLAKKLNEIAELDEDEQFDSSIDPSELREQLEVAVAGKGTEDGKPDLILTSEDDFTDHQWNVLAELGNPTALGEEDEDLGEEDEEEGEEEESEDEESEDEEGEEEESEDEESEDEEGEEEEAEEGVTLEDLNKMTKKKDLKTVAEEYELEVDTSQKVDALRQEIAEKLELVEPEEEGEEEEEGGEDEGDAPSIDEIRSMKKKDLKEVVENHELEVDTDLKLNYLREEVISAIHGDEEEEEESEEEEEGLTLEDLQGMTKKKELKQVIKDNDLETDPSEFKKVDDLRQAIAEELELVEPEEEGEEDEEEEETPLSEVVQNTKKLGELKDLVKEHDEFKALRKKLDDYKGSEGRNNLKSKMLKKLGVEDTSSKSNKSEGKKKEKGESKIKQIVNIILEESRTPKELVEEAENRGLSPASMRSAISHCKKQDQLARYGMPDVIDKDDDGIIKLAKNCKKNKKKSSSGKASSKKGSSKKSKK